MKFITQKNALDCGIAVCAMLAGLTYNQAAKLDKKPDSETGLTLSEFSHIMKMAEKPVQVTRRHYRKRLDEVSLLDIKDCGILLVNPDPYFEGLKHWITTDGEFIFDSWFRKKTSPAKYEYGDWIILRILTPTPAVTGSTTT